MPSTDHITRVSLKRYTRHHMLSARARLKAVLQTLRDRITVNEAADFAAQLPTIVRGLYFEEWHPAVTPHKAGQSRVYGCL